MNKERLESYKKCFRCQKTNTDKIWIGCGENRVVYLGWCLTCHKEYHYSEQIVDVFDKEERI